MADRHPLLDNVADLLLADEGPATRPPLELAAPPAVSARFLEGGRTGDALRAEHGFSCLVSLEKAGRTTTVLFDRARTRLVVLTGCGHSGIVTLFEQIIAPTCDALAAFEPDHLVPSYCTGWRATHAIADRLPAAFIQNSVGTRFEFR